MYCSNCGEYGQSTFERCRRCGVAAGFVPSMPKLETSTGSLYCPVCGAEGGPYHYQRCKACGMTGDFISKPRTTTVTQPTTQTTSAPKRPYFQMARTDLARFVNQGDLEALAELERRGHRRQAFEDSFEEATQPQDEPEEEGEPALETPAAPIEDLAVVIDEEQGMAEVKAVLDGKRPSSSAYYTALVRDKHGLREYDDQFELLCNDFLETHIEILPHQISAARTVFTEMNLRAILADEVGLGKTIEAGIIAKELESRGMLQSILVIAPKTLMGQWQDEFKEKFLIPLDDASLIHPRDFEEAPFVVANLRSWYREDSPVRKMLLERKWDLVIIDEAHHFKNHRSKGYKVLAGEESRQGIQAKYLLLLTATPVENELQELYSLLHLVRPGALGSFGQFKQTFFADKQGQMVRNEGRLKRLVKANMIRRRKIECGIDYTAREPKIASLPIPPIVRTAYERILDMDVNDLSKISSLRMLSSSIAAFRASAQKDTLYFHHPSMKDVWEPLRKLEEEGEPKMKHLQTIVKSHPKVVVFTEYRESQRAIRQYLQDECGVLVHELHGGLTIEKRRQAIRAFKDKGGVFVSTPAGAEGINLQFADTVVNFDLPWNPMKVEQRVGRVHRLGQKATVKIYSMAYANTIEDFILSTLYRKLELFRMSVGEIDSILTSGETDDYELETDIRSLITERASLAKIRERLEQVATDRAVAAKERPVETTLMEKIA